MVKVNVNVGIIRSAFILKKWIVFIQFVKLKYKSFFYVNLLFTRLQRFTRQTTLKSLAEGFGPSKKILLLFGLNKPLS